MLVPVEPSSLLGKIQEKVDFINRKYKLLFACEACCELGTEQNPCSSLHDGYIVNIKTEFAIRMKPLLYFTACLLKVIGTAGVCVGFPNVLSLLADKLHISSDIVRAASEKIEELLGGGADENGPDGFLSNNLLSPEQIKHRIRMMTGPARAAVEFLLSQPSISEEWQQNHQDMTFVVHRSSGNGYWVCKTHAGLTELFYSPNQLSKEIKNTQRKLHSIETLALKQTVFDLDEGEKLWVKMESEFPISDILNWAKNNPHSENSLLSETFPVSLPKFDCLDGLVLTQSVNKNIHNFLLPILLRANVGKSRKNLFTYYTKTKESYQSKFLKVQVVLFKKQEVGGTSLAVHERQIRCCILSFRQELSLRLLDAAYELQDFSFILETVAKSVEHYSKKVALRKPDGDRSAGEIDFAEFVEQKLQLYVSLFVKDIKSTTIGILNVSKIAKKKLDGQPTSHSTAMPHETNAASRTPLVYVSNATILKKLPSCISKVSIRVSEPLRAKRQLQVEKDFGGFIKKHEKLLTKSKYQDPKDKHNYVKYLHNQKIFSSRLRLTIANLREAAAVEQTLAEHLAKHTSSAKLWSKLVPILSPGSNGGSVLDFVHHDLRDWLEAHFVETVQLLFELCASFKSVLTSNDAFVKIACVSVSDELSEEGGLGEFPRACAQTEVLYNSLRVDPGIQLGTYYVNDSDAELLV